MKPSLQFKLNNVFVNWGKQKILKKLNLSWDLGVKPDDSLAVAHAKCLLPLMGPSGEGKSTLLYALAGLKWPNQGEVEWHFPDGYRIKWGQKGLKSNDSSRLRRNYFGFLFQDSTLSDHITIRENLLYPLTLKGVRYNEGVEKAITGVSKVGLSEKILNKFPKQVSVGHRQCYMTHMSCLQTNQPVIWTLILEKM